MAKTGIIGHRGAAGLALENSLASVHAALRYPIDAIEIDIHRSRDGALIVLHDDDTGRIANQRVRIADATLAELQRLPLHDGHELPTFEQVISVVEGRMPLIIDIKDIGCVDDLARILGEHPTIQASFTSLHLGELQHIQAKIPAGDLFVRDRTNPFRIIQTALRVKARGISLNKWLINPLTYRLARKNGLVVCVYTVNSRMLGKLLRILYPRLIIFTDHPERFVAPTGDKS